MRKRLLHKENRAAEVHLVRLRQSVDGHRPERLRQRVRGVVHDDVDAAVLVDGARDERAEILDIAEVGWHPDGLATEVAQMRGGFFAGVGFAARHDDARAGEDETLRQGQADSAGAARHDDGAVGHVEETVECSAVHAGQLNTPACAATYCSTVCAGAPVICSTSSVLRS